MVFLLSNFWYDGHFFIALTTLKISVFYRSIACIFGTLANHHSQAFLLSLTHPLLVRYQRLLPHADPSSFWKSETFRVLENTGHECEQRELPQKAFPSSSWNLLPSLCSRPISSFLPKLQNSFSSFLNIFPDFTISEDGTFSDSRFPLLLNFKIPILKD